MLMVRLQRVGRKHEPVFRLVLTDSKNGPKSGKFQEILGHFDARQAEKAVFKEERVKHWVANGAKLSDTVHNLFVERKIIEGKKVNALPKKTATKVEELKDEKSHLNNEGGQVEKLETEEIKEPEKIEEKQEDKTEAPEQPTAEIVDEKVL